MQAKRIYMLIADASKAYMHANRRCKLSVVASTACVAKCGAFVALYQKML